MLAVSSERHRTWDALLADVTRLLEHPLHLAAGVRYIFTLQGNKIELLEEMSDSCEYVASSTDAFKTIDYRGARLPQWRLLTKRREALHVPSSNSSAPTQLISTYDFPALRPRLVTVLRNGQRPRKVIRFLLNRRTARALDQVMEDLSTSLKLDTGAVRKIFTLSGRQVRDHLRSIFNISLAWKDQTLLYNHFMKCHQNANISVNFYNNFCTTNVITLLGGIILCSNNDVIFCHFRLRASKSCLVMRMFLSHVGSSAAAKKILSSTMKVCFCINICYNYVNSPSKIVAFCDEIITSFPSAI